MVSGAGTSGGAAHSASTGGGGGSPSDRGGAAPSASASVSTPASESTVARRLNGLDLQGDDAPSSQPAARCVTPAGLIPSLVELGFRLPCLITCLEGLCDVPRELVVFCGFELRWFGRVDSTMPICICSCSRFALCVVFSLFWSVGIAELVEVVASVFRGSF
jgi:hypothetical protein